MRESRKSPNVFCVKKDGLCMITTKDLCDIAGNKKAKDIGKGLIRKSFPPHIAERLCDDVIDRRDSVDKFNRRLMECWRNDSGSNSI